MKDTIKIILFSFLFIPGLQAAECPASEDIVSAMYNLSIADQITQKVEAPQNKVVHSTFNLDYLQPITVKEIPEKTSTTCIYANDEKPFYILILNRNKG